MKITEEQRNAASLYWTQILTGELNPKALIATKKGFPSFLVPLYEWDRESYLRQLKQTNPTWSEKFMNTLDSLLIDAEDTLCLRLEYYPQGLLKQAAEDAGVREILFPTGKLSMTFDNENHIIAGNEKIDAHDFIENAAHKITASF